MHDVAQRRMGRRRLLAQTAAAGAVVWVAPAIVGVTPAAAATSAPIIATATSNLWKWNANPPVAATVCTTGPSGNADRGDVTFSLKGV